MDRVQEIRKWVGEANKVGFCYLCDSGSCFHLNPDTSYLLRRLELAEKVINASRECGYDVGGEVRRLQEKIVDYDSFCRGEGGV